MNYFTRKRDAELHYSKLSDNNDILLVARDIAKTGAKNFVTVGINTLYNKKCCSLHGGLIETTVLQTTIYFRIGNVQ